MSQQEPGDSASNPNDSTPPVGGQPPATPPPPPPSASAAAPGAANNPYGQAISQPAAPGYYPPQQGYAPAPGTYPQHPPMSQSDERMWGMLSYLLSILFGFLAPLVIYLVYRERSEFVKETSREALNLTITAVIVMLGGSVVLFGGSALLTIVFAPVGVVMFILSMIVYIGYAVAVLVFEIIGALRSNRGEIYRVPFILRLVK